MLMHFILLLVACLGYAEEPAQTIEDKARYPLLSPTLQQRKTAKIKLANGVEVYLVSDPLIDQSAAAVSVGVGSWQDPVNYPGMAHFLEHMLFMGSKAYPEESEYMEFIRDNGGTVNAFTAPDRTVYLFSVNNDAFLGALDRFSHFFIDPLFSPSCLQRELHAVDQEHAKNVENDAWREHMVLKETSSPEHPHCKFSTGNAKTLSGIPQEEVKAWYTTHYSADKLHVILLSTLPIEVMKELSIEKFSPVLRRECEVSSTLGPILSPAQKGHFLYIQPLRDLKQLSLVWELPSLFCDMDMMGVGEFLAYALEQASEQGLLHQLKQESLVEELSAGMDRYGKNNVFFRVDISLTQEGLSQVDTIILRCFEMLARLKQSGLPSALFEERQTLARLHYQYQSKEEPFSWISRLAYAIVDEELETFPEKSSIPEVFHPEALDKLLSYLTPASAVYVLLADLDTIHQQPTKQETWMQVPYSLQPVSEAKLCLWAQAAPPPSFLSPPENPFVPKALTVLDQPTLSPSLVHQGELGTFYFATDEAYKGPEVSFLLTWRTPFLDGSARSQVLVDLLSRVLEEQLSSSLFFAKAAGLSANFFYKDLGFHLSLYGFSEKAPDFTQDLCKELKNLSCPEERLFAQYKAALQSSYTNEMIVLPVRQALTLSSHLLLQSAPTPQEKWQALQTLSLKDFSIFCQEWLSCLSLEGFLFGNLTKDQAQDLCKNLLQEYAKATPYLTPQKQHILLLPENQGPFKLEQKTERQGNGVVLTIQQGSFSFTKEASQKVLSTVLEEAFFATLRTKQQTAYMAHAWSSHVDHQLLQHFAVQSSTHLPEDLLHRFELFLEDFTKKIEEILPKERFLHLKEVQLTSLTAPLEDMSSMAMFLKELAFTHDADFLRKQKQIEALKALSYEQLLEDAKTFFSKNNNKRLAVLVEGNLSKPFLYKPITREEAWQMGSFHPQTSPLQEE
ncbi:MAG: hypothetical protein FJZ58_04160 [Chlamydiae bacterium]|nr:hypothetical protein [Chlamydiota bacterium]